MVAAGASIAAYDPQRLVQCIVGHWHGIVIGRPADRGSALSRQSRAKRNLVDRRSRLARGEYLARHRRGAMDGVRMTRPSLDLAMLR